MDYSGYYTKYRCLTAYLLFFCFIFGLHRLYLGDKISKIIGSLCIFLSLSMYILFLYENVANSLENNLENNLVLLFLIVVACIFLLGVEVFDLFALPVLIAKRNDALAFSLVDENFEKKQKVWFLVATINLLLSIYAMF